MTVENYNKITQKRYMENISSIALNDCRKFLQDFENIISIRIRIVLPNRRVVIELALVSNSENFVSTDTLGPGYN